MTDRTVHEADCEARRIRFAEEMDSLRREIGTVGLPAWARATIISLFSVLFALFGWLAWSTAQTFAGKADLAAVEARLQDRMERQDQLFQTILEELRKRGRDDS